MKLFPSVFEPPLEILPKDGSALYFGQIFDEKEADNFYRRLLEDIEWSQDKALIFGKMIRTKRMVAWYGDQPFEYTYSGTTKQAKRWTENLQTLKAQVEEKSTDRFNSCLLNLYHDGEEGMAWHSDSERELKRHGAIASLSLGAERKFSFKHKKTKDRRSLILEHGSLLVMKGQTQENWLHCVPKSKRVSRPRINLTFRTILVP